jgi:nicotinamidase-related amidase
LVLMKSETQKLAPDKSDTVLLILDLISDFGFSDAARLFRAALPAAKRIARLKARARRAGVPAIYVNDNYGRWRSDFGEVMRLCSRSDERAATLLELIGPDKTDYCILKPKHSGFFATALDTLLGYIGAQNLVLTGVSANQCVLFTANDAYVREYRLWIPRDCIASATRRETQFALQYFKTELKADVRPSARIRFSQMHRQGRAVHTRARRR